MAQPNPMNPMYQQEISMMSMQGQPVPVYPMQQMQPQMQQGPMMTPMMTPQNMMIPGVDPMTHTAIDVDLATTFGPMLFNLQDPYYLQYKNTPRKLENSIHKWPLIMSIYMIAAIAAGAVCLALQLIRTSPVIGPVIIIVHGYILYVILSFCCSDTRGYIMNTKPFSLYQETYDSMVRAAPYFRFHIECYHYETRRDNKGRTRQVKVTTHTASEQYHPRSWVDESGQLGNINETQEYIFLKYNSRFYFSTPEANGNYSRAYNSFMMRNTRDSHQNKSSSFQIPGFQEEIGFKARGESSQTVPLFFVFTFLGMGYVYNMCLERSVARYELNILKNING